MNVNEFEDLIDRLGEDMSRWPAAQREAAEGLLASSPEAQAILDEARILRMALAAPAVKAPPGLAERIIAAAGKLVVAPPAPETADDSAAGPAKCGVTDGSD